MTWYRCGGNTTIGLDTILENGQVSTTSNYATAYFNDISDYTYLFTKLKFNYNGVDYVSVWGFYTYHIPTGSYYEFTYYTDSDCPLPTFKLKFTHTSVELTHYNGDFRNIYCDIKGIKADLW